MALVLLGLCAVLFAGGLAFRATIYDKLPVAPGDAYGIADVIEYGLGMLLLSGSNGAQVLFGKGTANNSCAQNEGLEKISDQGHGNSCP